MVHEIGAGEFGAQRRFEVLHAAGDRGLRVE